MDVLNSDGAGFARDLLDYLAGMGYLLGHEGSKRTATGIAARTDCALGASE
jgi:hypothetical protein